MSQQRFSNSRPICDWCGRPVSGQSDRMIDARRWTVHESCFIRARGNDSR